jgi:multidrug efflux pump subunit AcrA (membrane-fusion protein)
MYATVELSPRTLTASTVVPTQAVQTGPENRFIYVVGNDGKVAPQVVTVPYIDERFAVVAGNVQPGTRVVVEGAQNLRPGASVTEGTGAPAASGDEPAKPDKADNGGKGGKGKGAGKSKSEA